ncbi:MAG: CBS domain-containing protein [Aliiglaciecola sp.]|uniref:CBS domain-containing protein n=1 Tax=Aliiglaciecola sp. TaxID=1872441 RepID=UPI003299C6B9
MKIKTIMTTDIVCVQMDSTLSEVKRLFENHKFHHLLVVENTKLVGILSDRDYLKAISPNIDTAVESLRDSASLNKRVHQIMSRDLVTLSPTSGLFKAIQTFNANGVSCIPVINSEFQPVGILSWRDVFKFVETKQIEKYLSK